jgi:hypothetical protein
VCDSKSEFKTHVAIAGSQIFCTGTEKILVKKKNRFVGEKLKNPRKISHEKKPKSLNFVAKQNADCSQSSSRWPAEEEGEKRTEEKERRRKRKEGGRSEAV